MFPQHVISSLCHYHVAEAYISELFGWDNSTTLVQTEQIAIKFSTNIHVPKKINATGIREPLTFPELV